MLSIGLIKSAAQAAHYYDKDDYYLPIDRTAAEHSENSQEAGRTNQEQDNAAVRATQIEAVADSDDAQRVDSRQTQASGAGVPSPPAERGATAGGEWYGRGAEALGLQQLQRDDFTRLLQGQLPTGELLGKQTPEGRQHTPGWDLTFSAPKSVSIMIEVGGDTRLLDAHHAAVKDALGWLEKNAVGTRVKRDGATDFVRTDSLVAALVTHHTSRNQEPNTHTHAVVMNMTQRSDGAWRSLHSKELFNYKMAAGQVYRSALAQRAVALGFEITASPLSGTFELSGVPQSLIAQFSTRRQEVLAKLETWGKDDAESAARAALVTRERKRPEDLAHLREVWREQLTQQERDSLSSKPTNSRENPPQAEPVTVSEALKDSIRRAGEREAVFTHADLVRYALMPVMGVATAAAVEREIGAQAQSRSLQDVSEAGRRLWTTARATQQERLAVRTPLRAQSSRKPIATPQDIQRSGVLKPLTEGQRAAATLILTNRDQFVGVEGRPGTGKTTLVKAVKAVAASRGYKLIGMAQNANAAKQLATDAGIEASTIHRHMRNIAADLAAVQKGRLFGGTLARWRHSKDLWIVDESSQLPNALARRLVRSAEILGARVAFIGDTKQLPAIEAGKPFALQLGAGMAKAEMNEVLRQRDPADVAIVNLARAGEVAEAIARLSSRTHENPDVRGRLTAIVSDWARRTEKGGPAPLIVTATNRTRRTLNEGVRDVLRGRGELRGELPSQMLEKVSGYAYEKQHAEFYKPGYLVYFPHAAPSLGVRRGEYREVAAVDRDANSVTLVGGRDGRSVVSWNPKTQAVRGKSNVTVFERIGTTVAPGETIRWGHNDRSIGLVNGDLLTVTAVEKGAMTVRDQGGRESTIDTTKPRGMHWSHAYASTIYSSQGRTAGSVLAHLESGERELLSQKAFLVALSRHRDEISVYTDSVERLVGSVVRNIGDKTSALEAHRKHGGAGRNARGSSGAARERDEGGDLQRAERRPERSL